MWEWILETLNRLCRSDNIGSIKGIAEADDIKQEVCLYLTEHKKEAEEIYQKQKVAYLNKLVKRVIYDMKAKTECERKQEFSSYQRMLGICEKYQISMTVENAYKISHIMESENYSSEEFTIQNVINFIDSKHPHDTALIYETGHGKDGGSYD